MNSSLRLSLSVMVLLATLQSTSLGQEEAAVEESSPEAMGFETSTSLLVVGDTTAAPLDEASLNALFSAGFADELIVRLTKSLDAEIAKLAPPDIQFAYINGSQSAKEPASKQGRIAVLGVTFTNVPSNLRDALRIEAPNEALKLVRDRVNDFLRTRQELESDHIDRTIAVLTKRRQQLYDELREREAESMDRARDSIESTDTLREHFAMLKEQQRQDRMGELDAAARREAIEKQIERVQKASASRDSADDGLLGELRTAMEARLTRLEQLKENDKLQVEIKAAKARVDAQAVTLNRVDQLVNDGVESQVKLQEARAKLIEAEARLEFAHQAHQQRIAEAEAKAMQGKIEYLRALEQKQQAQFGGQLQELNDMLTKVAITSDEKSARRGTLEVELDKVAGRIQHRMQADLGSKRLKFRIRMLEDQLERVERELFELKMQRERPTRQEIVIMPWGG